VTWRCILCGRPDDEPVPSWSSYLDRVGDSRCPECGKRQGVDVEGLQTEVERLRVLAQAVDEFVSAAECRCCGGVPYCDHHVEKKAVNEKGRAMTEALREVKP